MSLSTQPYKGARDFYPEDKRIQKFMFNRIREVVEGYGYQEYDAPILESLDLYVAKSGEEIVNEQTYQFEDRGGRRVAIRPEMTPTVSRMVAAKRQELAYPLRWYSIPNLWRYERPQRGRLREHWQLNVDVFGLDNISAETEMILVASDILKRFGADESMFEFRINSRKLIDRIMESSLKLDDVTARNLIKLIDRKNKLPLEKFSEQLKDIVGNKNEKVIQLLGIGQPDDLPEEILDSASVKNIKYLIESLGKVGVNNIAFDMTLMRGFDYYTDIVFEVFDTNPINNRSMFGGGRYDGLVGLFGVEQVPTVGFGMGDVTLQNFLEANSLVPVLTPETDLIMAGLTEDLTSIVQLAAKLRNANINVAVDSTGRKIDKIIKSASKANIQYITFVGDQELETKKFGLKNLNTSVSEVMTINGIINKLKK